MLPEGFQWNEALSGEEGLHPGLAIILSHGPDRVPHLIGTAFIIGAYGHYAVAVTAAHNFSEGVLRVQNPSTGRHLSALPDFWPEAKKLSLNSQSVRAIYRNGKDVEMCRVGIVAWENRTDFAFMTLHPQDEDKHDVFRIAFALGARPELGDVVGLLGFGDMKVVESFREEGREGFTTASRLILRAGRVSGDFPDRHILCKGPCVETTIPVLSGMSGGPVFLYPGSGRPIMPFGVISSGPEREENNLFGVAGSSIAALLPHKILPLQGAKQLATIEFAPTEVAFNPEIDFSKVQGLAINQFGANSAPDFI